MLPSVTCVVLNWRGLSDSLACLEALKHVDYPCLEVLVVDNGSGDGSAEAIRSAFPCWPVLALAENLGFAGGNNEGIRWAFSRCAEFVWLLNNDARPDRGALRAMVRLALADPRLGAVGSVINDLTAEQRVQEWGGGWFEPTLGRFAAHRQPPTQGRLHYISGASLLIRRTAAEEVGQLDDRFFFYGEDIDFGIRLRRAGWRLGVAPDARVWHRRAGSGLASLDREYYLNAASARLVRKHHRAAPLTVPLGFARRSLKSALLCRWRRVFAKLAGTVAGWRSASRDLPYGPIH